MPLTDEISFADAFIVKQPKHFGVNILSAKYKGLDLNSDSPIHIFWHAITLAILLENKNMI